MTALIWSGRVVLSSNMLSISALIVTTRFLMHLPIPHPWPVSTPSCKHPAGEVRCHLMTSPRFRSAAVPQHRTSTTCQAPLKNRSIANWHGETFVMLLPPDLRGPGVTIALGSLIAGRSSRHPASTAYGSSPRPPSFAATSNLISPNQELSWLL